MTELSATTELEHEIASAARGSRSSPPAAASEDRRGPLRPDRLLSTRKRIQSSALARLFRFGDLALILAAIRFGFDLVFPSGVLIAPFQALAPVMIGAVMISAAIDVSGAYDFRLRDSLSNHFVRLGAGLALAGAGIGALAFVTRSIPGEADALASFAALAIGALYLAHTAWWLLLKRALRAGALQPNVVFVGATRNAERLIEHALASREVSVLGVFDDRTTRAGRSVHGVPVLGDTSALLTHRVMPYVDLVVITVSSTARDRVNGLVERLRVLPNAITLFVDLGGADVRTPAELSNVLNAPVALLSGKPLESRRTIAKRLQDLVIGAIALLAFSPLMLLVAAAIKLDSPGPVFFRQKRQGFNNEEITVWKFRSMRHDRRDDAGVRQVSRGDDRVTRVGRFIRSTSLDELPQLFNVILGEMSLVGPRPHAPGMKTGDVESARIVAEYAHRHRIKPGMTGWAAIHGSRGPVESPEAMRRRVELDIAYIERQSFWLDLIIMLATVPVLLGDRLAER